MIYITLFISIQSFNVGFGPLIGGKYGLIVFFYPNFTNPLCPGSMWLLYSEISWWLGEDFLRFIVETVMFSLVLVCTKKGLLTYLIGLSMTADLLLTIFLSNLCLTLVSFFSSTSSSDSYEDKLTESSVTQDDP